MMYHPTSLLLQVRSHMWPIAWNKLEGDLGDIVSLQAEPSPYFQVRRSLNVKNIQTKVKPSSELLPETRKSEQNISQFQVTGLNPAIVVHCVSKLYIAHA